MKTIRTKYDLSKLTPEQTRNFQSLPLFWKRELIKQRCGGNCELCRQAKGRDLHHKTYKRIDRELPDDLAFICRHCHEALHHINMGWSAPRHDPDGTWPKTKEALLATIETSKEIKRAYETAAGAEVYWHNRANGIRMLRGVSYEGF